MTSRWRQIARDRITDCEAISAGMTLAEFKSALRAAYLFWERKYHPYKIWCDEQRKAILRFQGLPDTPPKPEPIVE